MYSEWRMTKDKLLKNKEKEGQHSSESTGKELQIHHKPLKLAYSPNRPRETSPKKAKAKKWGEMLEDSENQNILDGVEDTNSPFMI